MQQNDDVFFEKLYARDKRTLARAITYVESDYRKAESILNNSFHRTGNAYRIGITGPPGSGKSTITNQLTKYYRKEGKTVGIIAVDPTSPFSGGALLGDRIRMTDIGNDEGVYIRSMATRGSLGGLSKKAVDAADLLDAAGFDIILFETVGVGQSELDIVKTADTTAVVLVPESGDTVQAMKAGLMEIADFFIVNKCDRPGADQAVQAVKAMLQLRDHDENTYMPAILKVIAVQNDGIEKIASEIQRHRSFLENKNLFDESRMNKLKIRIQTIVENKIISELWGAGDKASLAKKLELMSTGSLSPYQAADKLIEEYKEIIIDKKSG